MTYQDKWQTKTNSDIDPLILLSQINSLRESLNRVEDYLKVKIKIKAAKTTLLGKFKETKIPLSDIEMAKSAFDQEWQKEWRAWHDLRQ